jgi:membrane fusion protein, adhesin transport system
VLHNLKTALRQEWKGKSFWRYIFSGQWFESDQRHAEDDLSYMSSAAGAVLQQSPRGGQQLLWSIAAFFLVAILWAAWAEVDEFTRGEGKVIPSSHVQVIQNLEGGIVAELHIREGQQVKANQVLLRIDDTQFSSSLREADVTLDQLEAKASRLRSEAESREFTGAGLVGVMPEVIGEELALYESRRNEQRGRSQVLIEQVVQKRQELTELQAKHEQLQRSYALLDSELQMTRPLADEGAISRVELLRLERQVNDLAGEMKQAKLSIPRAESGLQEVKEKLASVELEFRVKVRQELSEVLSELSRLTETSDALEDRVERTLVRSPVAGTVKQLLVKTIGGVIQPGMDIVEIVPTEDSLLVEAQVRPADIAFLHPGQKAVVKFSAYDFSIHGGLEGQLVHISPDTIVDENGESFYLVRVETDQAYLGSEAQALPIISGMTASVDILTGKKTVLDYILKPILKTKQLALRER